jgi:hypothetical protein
MSDGSRPPASILTRVLGEIPFPEGSPEHYVWTEASRRAAEESAALEAEFLRGHPEDLDSRRKWAVDFAVRRFDIQVKAILAITVTNFAAVARFETALARLSEAHAAQVREHPVPDLDPDEVAAGVRLALAARTADWVYPRPATGART